jgi:hypothetical protein
MQIVGGGTAGLSPYNRGMYTHVEVDANPNCPMSANMVYRNIGEPRGVTMVRIFEGEPEGKLFHVAGWSSENDGTPCPVLAVNVEDSSQGSAYLIYGGDWGIRLRFAESDGWSMDDPDQWGETHLVLADLEDIVFADGP